MALRLAAKDVTPPAQPGVMKLNLGNLPARPKDIPSLLKLEGEKWINDNRPVIDSHFGTHDIQTTGAPLEVDVKVAKEIPGAAKIEKLLSLGRTPLVQMQPSEHGSVVVHVTAPCNHSLEYRCDVFVSFPHKTLSATEEGLLRQSIQFRLVKQANLKVNALLHGEDLPVFALWGDHDLTLNTWSTEDLKNGFRIVRGAAAHVLLEETPALLKEDAASETPRVLFQLIPNREINAAYREALVDAMLTAYREGSGSKFALLSRAFGSSKEDEFTSPLDTLLGTEIAAQAAKDPGANEYMKKVGADPDRAREKYNAEKKAANDAKSGVDTEVRKYFSTLLSNEAIPGKVRGLLTQTQSSILVGLRKKDKAVAAQAIDEAIPNLPPEFADELTRLKEKIMG